MKQKKYSTKLKRDVLEGIQQLIDSLLQKEYSNDDDKLLMATLHQVSSKIYMKLDNVVTECSISFTASEAMALRILSNDYYQQTNLLGIRLHMIANEVHQLYN